VISVYNVTKLYITLLYWQLLYFILQIRLILCIGKDVQIRNLYQILLLFQLMHTDIKS